MGQNGSVWRVWVILGRALVRDGHRVVACLPGVLSIMAGRTHPLNVNGMNLKCNSSE